MPTEKIKDYKHKEYCIHPEHKVPSMQLLVLEPGRYRHTCPSCGEFYEFTVPTITV
jgi:hypothetical protein